MFPVESAKIVRITRAEKNRMTMGSTMICLFWGFEMMIDIGISFSFILSSLFLAAIAELHFALAFQLNSGFLTK
jgi:hypothetical protein